MIWLRWILVVLVIVAGAFTAVAQATEERVITLSLNDATTNQPIENVLAEITIKSVDKNEERTISSFLDTSFFSLKLEEGTYEFTVLLDDLDTSGKDYYAFHPITLTENEQADIALLPVGSVRGRVLDNLDNLVRNAALKIECSKEYGEKAPTTSDKYGSFTSLYLPVGECEFIATFGSAVGSMKVEIQQGQSEDITIKLDKSAIGQETNYFLGILFVLLFFGIVFLVVRIVFKRYKALHEKMGREMLSLQKHKKEEPKKGPSKRQEDILSTLSDREKKIVNHLLSHKNESSQSKIRHGTGIPKTSLTRIFQSLERKKVISIQKFGKLKKVKLTAWFLGKE